MLKSFRYNPPPPHERTVPRFCKRFVVMRSACFKVPPKSCLEYLSWCARPVYPLQILRYRKSERSIYVSVYLLYRGCPLAKKFKKIYSSLRACTAVFIISFAYLRFPYTYVREIIKVRPREETKECVIYLREYVHYIFVWWHHTEPEDSLSTRILNDEFAQ